MSALTDSLETRKVAKTDFPELALLLERIVAVYEPVDILLYGSRARGTSQADSDWDLKVIVRDDAPESLFSPMVGWSVQEGSGVYADVSCTKVSDFRADLTVANSAAREISRDGIVLELR